VRVPAAATLLVLLCLGLAAPLGGCGFRPHMGGGSAGAAAGQTGRVQISLIADRVGQKLRNELMQRINPRGTRIGSPWRLDVQIADSARDSGIQNNNTVTRKEVRLIASFSLVEVATGKVVLRDIARSNAAYNVSATEFGTVVSGRAAHDTAVTDIADEIQTRLAIYFDRLAQNTLVP
jgi:LPS-assembly lipoprotein